MLGVSILLLFKLFLKCSIGMVFCLRFSFHSFRYALKFSAHRRVSGITFHQIRSKSKAK